MSIKKALKIYRENGGFFRRWISADVRAYDFVVSKGYTGINRSWSDSLRIAEWERKELI
jgi:hypothetical protein